MPDFLENTKERPFFQVLIVVDVDDEIRLSFEGKDHPVSSSFFHKGLRFLLPRAADTTFASGDPQRVPFL